MAQPLIWSHEALDDIDRIAEYIGRDSLHHAQQVVERLFNLGDELPVNPKLGRIVPELADPNVRERFTLQLPLDLRNHRRGNSHSCRDSWQTPA